MILKWVDNTKNILYIYYIYIRYVCMLLTFDKICQELQFFLKNGSVDESIILVKGPLSGLKQFLTTESPLQVWKPLFYVKSTFRFKIFPFLPRIFGYKEKRLDKKVKVNFKINDVTGWTTNNYNKYNVQYLVRKVNQAMKFGKLLKYNLIIILLQKSCRK